MAARKKSTRSAAGPAERGRGRLVYIHGIGRQEPPAELKDLWDLALFGQHLPASSPVGESRMAYWADILHPPVPASRTKSTARRSQARGLDDGDPSQLDLGDALAEHDLDLEDPAVAELTAGLLRRLEWHATPGPGKRVLPLPKFLRRPVARAFLKAFIADTAAYFFTPGLRERIQQRLLKELPDDGDEPVTLVAHSQGTVIALEVLADRARAGRPVSVRRLVTIGSPLGIQEVQDFLSCDLVVPEGIGQWLNFADPLDPVALDKGLGNDYAPRHFIRDRLIMNERTPGGNPHSSLGYLSDPTVRREVTSDLHVDAMNRFLVARDVAAGLGAAPMERQPVLIEILQPGYPALGESPAECSKREAKDAAVTLSDRVKATAVALERTVRARSGQAAVDLARIDPLRRFVAAHLTPHEVLDLSQNHRELRVYKIWKSTVKSKLLNRSAQVVQADAARTSYGAVGQGIAWAILDTGVQADHPHFKANGNLATVWDCTQRGEPKRIDKAKDRDGHGTHVAGIIAGQAPDGHEPRLAGIAPRTQLHVYKVLDDQGSGEDAWIIKALDHIASRNENSVAMQIHGLNLSLGGPFDSTVYGCGFSPICAELRRLWRSGMVVVVASGNEGKVDVETSNGEVELNSPMSIGDPANLEDCIAVGSVNADKPHLYGISPFSSRGPTADGRLKPDVVAPGERISSCNANFRHSLYRVDSGTSMAAPHVSGLLAAFLSARREFIGRPDELKTLLLKTCTDLGRDRYHQGHGMPNLMKMLLEA